MREWKFPWGRSRARKQERKGFKDKLFLEVSRIDEKNIIHLSIKEFIWKNDFLQIFLVSLFVCASLARPQRDPDASEDFNNDLLDRLGPINVSYL